MGFIPLEAARISMDMGINKLSPRTMVYSSELIEDLRDIVSHIDSVLKSQEEISK